MKRLSDRDITLASLILIIMVVGVIGLAIRGAIAFTQ